MRSGYETILDNKIAVSLEPGSLANKKTLPTLSGLGFTLKMTAM